jgi:hypothetical protein
VGPHTQSGFRGERETEKNHEKLGIRGNSAEIRTKCVACTSKENYRNSYLLSVSHINKLTDT